MLSRSQCSWGQPLKDHSALFMLVFSCSTLRRPLGHDAWLPKMPHSRHTTPSVLSPSCPCTLPGGTCCSGNFCLYTGTALGRPFLGGFLSLCSARSRVQVRRTQFCNVLASGIQAGAKPTSPHWWAQWHEEHVQGRKNKKPKLSSAIRFYQRDFMGAWSTISCT